MITGIRQINIQTLTSEHLRILAIIWITKKIWSRVGGREGVGGLVGSDVHHDDLVRSPLEYIYFLVYFTLKFLNISFIHKKLF